jgi:hypothetical protein
MPIGSDEAQLHVIVVFEHDGQEEEFGLIEMRWVDDVAEKIGVVGDRFETAGEAAQIEIDEAGLAVHLEIRLGAKLFVLFLVNHPVTEEEKRDQQYEPEQEEERRQYDREAFAVDGAVAKGQSCILPPGG